MLKERRIQVPLAIAERIQLPHVDPEKRLRLKANYPLLPLPDGLINPEVLLPAVRREGSDMGVDMTVFISRRKDNLTPKQVEELSAFNEQAYDLVRNRPGFRLYIQGDRIDNPDARLRSADLSVPFNPDCVSFCLWDSQSQAIEGSNTKPHLEAVRKVGEWYANYAIQKLTVRTEKDATSETIVFEDRGTRVLSN